MPVRIPGFPASFLLSGGLEISMHGFNSLIHQRKHRAGLRAIVAFIAALWFGLAPIAPVVLAQTTTGTILGLVIQVDLKTPVPGSIVRIVNNANGLARVTRSDATGTYRFDLILPGVYTITATADGYKPNAIQNFIVEVNREKVIKPPPIVLDSTTAPVTQPPVNPPTVATQPNTPPPPPTQGTTQANTADPTLRSSATAEFILSLPLRGVRNFDSFALLSPGVSPPPAFFGANGPGVGSELGGGDFAVNGTRPRGNNYTIDGSDNNDQEVGGRRRGYTATAPQSIESLREFQITTLLSDVEAGRNVGGQVNVVSRSGENTVHGGVYSFLTDSRIQARDAFDFTPSGATFRPGKNAFTRHQSGATLGGPIVRNRWHFFASVERQDVNRSQTVNYAVPTAAERVAALALNPSPATNLLAPDVLALYPLPNFAGGPFGVNNFTQVLPAKGNGTLFSIRSDYQFAPFGKQTLLTTRYNLSDDGGQLAAIGNAINSSIGSDTRTQNFALDLTTQLSDRFSNEFRFSYGRNRLGFNEVAGSPFIFQSRNIGVDLTGDGQTDGRTGPLGRLSVAPYSSIGVDPGTFPQGRTGTTFHFADTFLWNHGRGSLKFGADIRRVTSNSFNDKDFRLTLSYAPNIVIGPNGTPRYGSGADFVALGVPSDLRQTFVIDPDSDINLRNYEYNFFINETFRIHPRVVIKGGLRYELNTVPTDTRNNRYGRAFDLNPGSFQPPPGGQNFSAFFNALNSYQGFVGGRSQIFDPDTNNISGRVGVAWDIFGNGRTALRAGYGLFYDPIPLTVTAQSRNLFPASVQTNFRSGVIFDDILSANPSIRNFGPRCQGNFPPFSRLGGKTGSSCPPLIPPGQIAAFLNDVLGAGNFALAFTLPQKNMQSGRVHQYSVSIEHSFADRIVGSIAYVGTTGSGFVRPGTPNGGSIAPLYYFLPTSTDPFGGVQVVTERNDGNVGAISGFSSDATSRYHALQIAVRQRFNSGLAFQSAYTWSHSIDAISDLFDTAGGYARAQNELDRDNIVRAERGDSSFDVRHRFTTGVQYELPFYRGHRFLGGWQVSSIVTLQSGQPYTINTLVDANRDGNRTDRLDTLTGLTFRDSGVQRVIINPGVNPLSLTAFNQLTGRDGSLGRNSFRSSGFALVDMAFNKRFNFGERYALSLRAEVFNLFNRTHFGIPVRLLEAPGFGRSTATSAPPRQFQFVLKFEF